MSDQTEIRTATQADLDELLRIAKLLHQENGQHPLSERKLIDLMVRGISKERAMIGVIGKPDDIRAMIYLAIESPYYSDDLQLVELFNYVRPDSRKSDFAARLIEYAKRCSDQVGLDLVIGIVSDHQLEAKRRLYERHLPKGGVFFVYNTDRAAAKHTETHNRKDALDGLSKILFERVNFDDRSKEWQSVPELQRSRFRKAVKDLVQAKSLLNTLM